MTQIVKMGLTEPYILPYNEIIANGITGLFLGSADFVCPEIKVESDLVKSGVRHEYNINYTPNQKNILNSRGVYIIWRKNPFDADNDSCYVGSTLISFRKRFSKIIQYIHGVFHNGDHNLPFAKKWREKYGVGNTSNMYVRFFPLNNFSNEGIKEIEALIIKNIKNAVGRHKCLNVVEYATSSCVKETVSANNSLCDFIS